jgi:hypothetical protein
MVGGNLHQTERGILVPVSRLDEQYILVGHSKLAATALVHNIANRGRRVDLQQRDWGNSGLGAVAAAQLGVQPLQAVSQFLDLEPHLLQCLPLGAKDGLLRLRGGKPASEVAELPECRVRVARIIDALSLYFTMNS